MPLVTYVILGIFKLSEPQFPIPQGGNNDSTYPTGLFEGLDDIRYVSSIAYKNSVKISCNYQAWSCLSKFIHTFMGPDSVLTDILIVLWFLLLW